MAKQKPTEPIPVAINEKVYQEFYCAKSGGGCGGFIMVKVNMYINGVVKVICPKCGHVHGRFIQDGRIVEEYAGQSHYLGKSRNDNTSQELIPTMAAYSEKPRSAEYTKDVNNKNERNSPVFPNHDEARRILRESQMERYGK